MSTYTGIDFANDGTTPSGSPSLDQIGTDLLAEGRRPTAFRMGGLQCAALAEALFKGANLSYVLDDGRVVTAHPSGGARIGTYVNKASGGHAVRIVVDSGVPSGEVRVESTELEDV